MFYNKHCKAWRPADLLKWDTGVFLSIFQCNLICTPHANGCFCDVFFVSFFLFSQRKNSFLKSSSLKTGYTSRVISRGVLAARLFSSMMSKNQILSKPVMNVVHQIRWGWRIKFIFLWEVAGCSSQNHSWLNGHHFLNWKLIFRVLYVLYHIQVSQEWVETMRIVFKYRSSRPEKLYKNQSAENVRKLLGVHQLWSPVSVKLQNEGLKFSITSKKLHRSNQQHHYSYSRRKESTNITNSGEYESSNISARTT